MSYSMHKSCPLFFLTNEIRQIKLILSALNGEFPVRSHDIVVSNAAICRLAWSFKQKLKKKNPDNDMNYLYLKKVKYRNIFDQMNKEVLSSQGFFP